MAHCFVDATSTDQGASSALDEFLHSVRVEIVDHLALELATLRLLSIHHLEFDLDGLDKLLDS